MSITEDSIQILNDETQKLDINYNEDIWKMFEDKALNAFLRSDEEENIEIARKYMETAYELSRKSNDLNPNLNNSRLVALTSGRLAELAETITEKIQYGLILEEFIKKANDLLIPSSSKFIRFELLHLKGRLALTISSMSLQSHIDTINEELSQYTLQDAVECFEKAEQIRANEIENQFYLAFCYELYGDYDSALMWFHEVAFGKPLSFREEQLVEKAKNKLPEHWQNGIM